MWSYCEYFSASIDPLDQTASRVAKRGPMAGYRIGRNQSAGIMGYGRPKRASTLSSAAHSRTGVSGTKRHAHFVPTAVIAGKSGRGSAACVTFAVPSAGESRAPRTSEPWRSQVSIDNGKRQMNVGIVTSMWSYCEYFSASIDPLDQTASRVAKRGPMAGYRIGRNQSAGIMGYGRPKRASTLSSAAHSRTGVSGTKRHAHFVPTAVIAGKSGRGSAACVTFAIPSAGESRAPRTSEPWRSQVSIDNGKRRRHCFKRLPFGRYAEARGD